MKKPIRTWIYRKWQTRLAATLVCASLALPSVAHAATFTVTKLADTNDGVCDSDCSLREALNAADNNPFGDFTTVDIITFASSVRGTIALNGDRIATILAPVELLGPGANLLTISGSSTLAGILSIAGSPSAISGLTFRDGFIPDSASSNDGGGAIYNVATLTVRDCAFINNKSPCGGAIGNYGRLLAENCTFANNTATNLGGAIYNQAYDDVIRNCTLTGNKAHFGGALYNPPSNHGPVSIEHCTITGNNAQTVGSGVCNSSEQIVSFSNSIVAGNSTDYPETSPSDVYGSSASGPHIQSNGYNLIGGDSGIDGGDAGYGAFTNHDLTGITDPKLGPLADNGGPTQTMAPLPNSPALNAGDPAFAPPPDTDQRGPGFNRVRDGRVDIGAFEFFVPTLSVNNPRSLNEGSAAAPGSTTFDITLNGPSTQTISVKYQTANGINNPATAGSDYVAKSGKVTFLPGETLKRVTIQFIGDNVPELNETFFLDLQTPTNAPIADSRGVGTLVNDDGPSLTIEDALAVDEGNSGTSPQKFIVRLSAPSSVPVTVAWATTDGTAVATADGVAGATDYVAASGTLNFAPGQTSKLITILVNGDTKAEPNETYKVNLSKPTYALIADGSATATIRNDDATPSLFQNDAPSS